MGDSLLIFLNEVAGGRKLLGATRERAEAASLVAVVAPQNQPVVGQLKKFGDFEPGNYGGRNIHFGVREHAMGSIVNGILVNGFLRAFGATFFNFSDYQRPAVRMSGFRVSRPCNSAAIVRAPPSAIGSHADRWGSHPGRHGCRDVNV